MTARLYYYDGAWRTYDYLHDRGFTRTASTDVVYLSALDNDWGEEVTTGYYSGDYYDLRVGEFFVDNNLGWYTLNNVAVQCSVIPDINDQTDTSYTFTNGLRDSHAAMIEFTDIVEETPQIVPYYLLQANLAEGWHTLDEWEALGWTIGSCVRGVPLGGVIDSSSNTITEMAIPNYMSIGHITFTGDLKTETIPQGGVMLTSILAYKADGTTAECDVNSSGQFRIAAIDNSWHSEADINAAGWYVQWRIYSTNTSGWINIRDGGSVYNTNVVAKFYPGQKIYGNPFLEQVDPNDANYSMQKFRYSTNSGTTIQTAWVVSRGNNTVTYVEGFVTTDISLISGL